MARAINRLTARTVTTLKTPGLHADGQGLYLRVDPGGARRWVWIAYIQGRRREMGLGGALDVTLAEARQHASAARRRVREGVDPILARRAAARPKVDTTFEAVAVRLLNDLAQGWRDGGKSRDQWESSLKQHAPVIWAADVARVDTEMVLAALRPIWTAKAETARRLRSRLERVLDAAKARGLRNDDNPARWKGHLDVMLTRRRSGRAHHAALPYDEAPTFMAALREMEGFGARALEFAILTAARTGEVLGMTWDEVQGDVWTAPASRMKGGREHRVPLTARAVEVLDAVRPYSDDLVFPGSRRGKPLSNMSLAAVLKRMKVEDATPHGFRSTFRDWAGDCTEFPSEVAEAALAHMIGDSTEQAYRRATAFEKRRKLMDAWATYLASESMK